MASDSTDKYMLMVTNYLRGFQNKTVDFKRPYLKPSVQNIYPLFITIYATLSVCGGLANVAMITMIFKRNLQKTDPKFCFLINLALSHIVMCVVVLPLSLTVMLIQNWIFGAGMCYCLPMIQDLPLHVNMLTFVLMAADRHRQVLYPMRRRLPGLACSVASWFGALIVVLPYPVYTTYLDLGVVVGKKVGSVRHQLEGVGICAVNLVEDMHEYTRGLFIVMFVLPLSVIAFLHVRISRELKVQFAAVAADTALHEVNGHGAYRNGRCERCDVTELDLPTEQRTQNFMIAITTIFATCLFPLTVLKMLCLVLIETDENSGHFDITFTLLVWVAFLPTCSTPILFALWINGSPAVRTTQLCQVCCLKQSRTTNGRSHSISMVQEDGITTTSYQPEFTSI